MSQFCDEKELDLTLKLETSPNCDRILRESFSFSVDSIRGERRTCCQKHNKKIFCLCLAGLVILIAAGLGLYFLGLLGPFWQTICGLFSQTSSTSKFPDPDKEAWKSPESERAAKRIQDALNNDLNPCSEMFKHSCSSWNKEHYKNATINTAMGELADINLKRIETIFDEYNGDDSAVLKTTNFYKSCINYKEFANSKILSGAQGTDNHAGCIKLTYKLFQEVVDNLFIRKYLQPETMLALDTLIEKVSNSFIEVVKTFGFDDISKSNIQNRINLIQFNTPKQINASELNSIYAGIPHLEIENFKENLEQVLLWKARMGSDVELSAEAIITSGTPIFDNMKHILSIPIGDISEPNFHFSFPKVLQHSKLGVEIARGLALALGHYLKGQNLEIPRLGTVKIPTNPLSSQSLEKLNNTNNCLLNQYDAVNFKYVYGPRDGRQTLLSNFVDILGIQVAYEAFSKEDHSSYQHPKEIKTKISENRIFFLSATQQHCAGELNDNGYPFQIGNLPAAPVRVWISLANFKSFSETYSCDGNANYSPETKCVI